MFLIQIFYYKPNYFTSTLAKFGKYCQKVTNKILCNIVEMIVHKTKKHNSIAKLQTI